MLKKLRVGIIGAGGIATGAHIPNYLKCGEKVEIIAICDVIKEKAENLATEFNIPHVK